MAIDVVAALIWDNDTFLICQRPMSKAMGLLWEFVGGKVEEGETKEEALIRECYEELGIEINVVSLFMEVVHEYPECTVNLSLYNAKINKGVPRLFEHNDYRWIKVTEIGQFKFCQADITLLKQIQTLYLNNKS